MTTTSPGNNPFAIALEDKLDAQYNDINIIECVIL